MGWLKKLGIGPQDAAEAVVDTAEGVADIVERWKPSEKAKHDMAREDYADKAQEAASARSYEPRTLGTDVFSTWVNVVVDAANRIVRPGLAITLMGGLFGWWTVTINTSDPLLVELSIAVFGFYFGVRAITQDLPKLLLALKQLGRGAGK